MGYKVDFDALDIFNGSINSRISSWYDELDKISTAMLNLQNSSNMSGTGADNIRLYFENVHGIILSLINELLSGQQQNCFLYKRDYFTNIDSALHAVIYEDELTDIKNEINSHNSSAINVDGEIAYALRSISDIFSVSYNDVGSVDAAHKNISRFLSELDEKIKNLENNHYINDFDDTDRLISTLEAFINEHIAQSRAYKSDFSLENLATSKSLQNLYDAYLAVSKEKEENADLLAKEIKNEDQRIADLQAEYEERQKKANALKWIITGAVVIGSVVVLAASGGTATPLVVGTVSAVSGTIITGTNNLADQYVQHGNIFKNAGKYDWASFGKDVAVSAVTGFATGCIGAGVGNYVTNALGKTAIGNTLLHSSSALTRIGTGAVIGTVSEVSSGILSRSAATLLTTRSLGESLKAGFDGKQMLTDAVVGGVGGGADQFITTKRAQKAADDFAFDYNGKHNPMKDAEEAGLENLKLTKNNGIDFSDSDYILRTESGEPIQIKIKSTGTREGDYKLAEKLLKEEYGIDIDFKSMRKGGKATHVWHHMDDYNVATNETTLQFIDIDAHQAIKLHTGSAKQYHIANGQGYKKDSFDANYSIDITGKISFTNSNISITTDNISEPQAANYQGYDGIKAFSYNNAGEVFARFNFDEQAVQ